MAPRKEFLEVAACPVCRIRLEVSSNNSALRCDKCHRSYPIVDGIPILLVDEAKIDEGAKSTHKEALDLGKREY